MKLRFVAYMGALAILFAGPMGCKNQLSPTTSDTSTVFFANGTWPTSNLRVCWEFKNYETEWFTSQFRTVVEKAFDGSKLQFTGWGVCPQDLRNSDLRLFIYDDPLGSKQKGFNYIRSLLGTEPDRGHPRVPRPGPQMRAHKANVILNLSGLDSDPFLGQMYASLSANGKRNLALSASLHEMGHAIGLRHENVHPDNTCVAFDENLEWGDKVVTPYNPGSFMQRCFYRNFDYENGIVWPNKGDIEGINKIYR